MKLKKALAVGLVSAVAAMAIAGCGGDEKSFY